MKFIINQLASHLESYEMYMKFSVNSMKFVWKYNEKHKCFVAYHALTGLENYMNYDWIYYERAI